MNAVINFLLYFLGTFISVLTYNFCYAKLNNHKFTRSVFNIIALFICTILVLCNNAFKILSLKFILNFIVLAFELKIIFKDSTKKVIVNYVFLFLIIILIEIMLTNLAYYLNLFSDNHSANSLTYSTILLSIAIGIVQYSIISINIIKSFIQNLVYYFIHNHTIKNTIILIFLTIALIAALNIENFANQNSIKLIIILLGIFIFLFMDSLRLRYHEEILKNSNQKLIEYNNKYGKFLDEYKIYKHNINHKLTAIKSYGNKKVNALIDDLLETENTFTIRNQNLYNIPNGIKGIVAEKLYNKEYDILIENKIKKDPFNNLSPKAFNTISESIGIALDNAIEASEETKNPLITIDLDENQDSIFIKIGNNFCNHIDIEKLGEKYYSTKNRESGLGLFSIVKNELVKEHINIFNDVFYIELEIKKAR